MVFLGGLHRSGTPLVFRLLRRHPLVSGFQDSGVKEDEGQHLQTVYPAANTLGGEGRFGFRSAAHLIEVPPSVAPPQAATLFGEWSRYWDLDRPVLIEKSPPNLIRMRYLQSLFPDARFVMVIRHPLEVALAQHRRARTQTLWSLLRHWFICHDTFSADAPHVERLLALRYEDLLGDPQATLDNIVAFAGLSPAVEASAGEVSRAPSQQYRTHWEQFSKSLRTRAYADALVRHFEGDANRYGYGMRDLSALGAWSLER